MLGLLLSVILIVWVAIARAIYVANFGYEEVTSLTAFAHDLLTTKQGHLIVVGNFVGFLFALLAFSLTVVSFPLLLDRNVGVVAAALTSVRVVLTNPITMALWGLIVACSLLAGFLAFLFGLALVMPVLGHNVALISEGGRTRYESSTEVRAQTGSTGVMPLTSPQFFFRLATRRMDDIWVPRAPILGQLRPPGSYKRWSGPVRKFDPTMPG
jgi:hypothetical protein